MITENIKFKTLSDTEIVNINDFTDVEVLFADTNIIQTVLNKLDKFINFDTYEKEFNDFYGLSIKKIKYDKLKNISFPYFIKPINNDKSFEAMIVENQKDLDDIKLE